MAENVRMRKHRKVEKKKYEDDETLAPSLAEKKRKLKELDEFIENVLEEAGEDFLDGFKQVEGQ